jgi:hypothetical protein
MKYGGIKMVNYEYTKINKIHEVNNDKVHNFYYIYYGKIYNEDKTRYRKFRYVEWFDIFDVQEFYDKDYITKEEIREYAYNLADHYYLTSINDYNDKKHLKEFYEYCNDTIRNYNSIIR